MKKNIFFTLFALLGTAPYLLLVNGIMVQSIWCLVLGIFLNVVWVCFIILSLDILRDIKD